MRCAPITVLALPCAAWRQCGPGFLRAADISTLPRIEAAGGVFLDPAGSPVDLPGLLASSGFNAVRLRVWVAPEGGWCDLASTLALAARARDAGLAIILDLHYSDTWADPGRQAKPAAWASLTFDQLGAEVEGYTAEVVSALAGQGTPPALVQIGNEITAGMLWPEGRVGGAFEGNWPRLARLLRAGVRGATGGPWPTPAIMLHIDRGADNGASRWFFDHAVAEQVPFDVIGLSYYPWWHGPLEDFGSNAADLAARYARPVMLVETAYPWTLSWSDATHNLVGLPEQLLPGFPATPDGQRRYLAAVRDLVGSLPAGLGRGVCAWAPEWSAFPGVGSPWENLALFDFDHRALPGLTAWSCCPADFNGDGFVDFFDYDDFVQCFETGSCPAGRTADFDADGFADFFDYDDFVNAFETGC